MLYVYSNILDTLEEASSYHPHDQPNLLWLYTYKHSNCNDWICQIYELLSLKYS